MFTIYKNTCDVYTCIRVSLLFLCITYREYKLATAWHVSCWRLSKLHNMTSGSRENRVVKVMLWFAKCIIHSRKVVKLHDTHKNVPYLVCHLHTGQKSLYTYMYMVVLCLECVYTAIAFWDVHMWGSTVTLFLLIDSVPFRSCCMFTFSININLYA